MSIDKQVRDLVKLEKTLRGICFTVSSRKDGVTKIKIGKKLDFAVVPSKEWGTTIANELTVVINRKADFVAEAITHVRARMEQLELDLFGNQEELDLAEKKEKRDEA